MEQLFGPSRHGWVRIASEPEQDRTVPRHGFVGPLVVGLAVVAAAAFGLAPVGIVVEEAYLVGVAFPFAAFPVAWWRGSCLVVAYPVVVAFAPTCFATVVVDVATAGYSPCFGEAVRNFLGLT